MHSLAGVAPGAASAAAPASVPATADAITAGLAYEALLPLAGLGLAWTFVHCAGMCGPLVLAFRIGQGRLAVLSESPAASGSQSGSATPRALPGFGPRAARCLSELALVQLGRALALSVAGAVAGGLGQAAATALKLSAPYLALGFGLLFTTMAAQQAGLLRRLGRRVLPRPADGDHAAPAWSTRLLTRLTQVLAARGPRLLPVLGLAFAALPCGVVAWALALAAASADPLRGALVLVGLVVLTTPVLALTALIGSGCLLPGTWRARAQRAAAGWFVPAAWALSGLWMAGLGLLRLLDPGCGCHDG